MYERTEHKGYGYRSENGKYHRQGLLAVQIVAEHCPVAAHNLNKRKGERRSQQFENHGNRGRRRHTQRIEHVEQHDVSNHYGQVDYHNVLEREHLGPEYAVPGNVHHPVAHYRAAKHTYGGYYHHRAETGGL